jgi:Helix-turn-helix of DDE superfamily endonuclease
MKRSTKIRSITPGASACFFYRAALPLSSRTLNFTAGLIRRHRKPIGSRWRKLPPGKQALLVLVYLRKGETYPGLAAGFGVGTATAWRYVERPPPCSPRVPRSCARRSGTLKGQATPT